MFKLLMATSVAILTCAAAGSAQGAVTVFGGGLAQACSKAAMSGEDDVKFQEVCTLALDTEAMAPRDRWPYGSASSSPSSPRSSIAGSLPGEPGAHIAAAPPSLPLPGHPLTRWRSSSAMASDVCVAG